MVKLRDGHAPGHVRDAFLCAVETYMNWEPGDPEPTVEYEVRYVPRQISLSKACGLVWNCTDIIPGFYFDWLANGAELEIGRRTYAACARAMKAAIVEATP